METDLASIIIAIIAFSVFLVPILYFEYYKKKATKKFVANFHRVAKKNSLGLTQYDVWCDQYGIGIDADAQKIIYHKQKDGQEYTVIIDLPDLKRCRISKQEDRINTPDGERRITKRIALQFEFLSPEKAEVNLEFYDERNEDSVRDEVKLSEKWSQMINSKIAKR